MALRVVVLISGGGSNLQALIDGQACGQLPIHIACVLSNKAEVGGLTRAEKAGIPQQVLDHRSFASREAFDAAMREAIDAYQPDLVVLAGFMRILTPEFVRHYLGRMLNIHPSLLPKYPGLHTHQRAIDAGDREAGVTVHFVTEELDGGPAVIQAKVPILDGDDADTLAARVLVQEHQIYPLAVHWFAEGRLQLTPQGASLDGELLASTGHLIET